MNLQHGPALSSPEERDISSSTSITGDFETHLTIEIGKEPLARLREFCAQRGLKCVHILLDRGQHTSQPMVTWRSQGELAAMRIEAARQVQALEHAGFHVVRLKLETAPHSTGVRHDEPCEPPTYFEHHVKLLLAGAAPPSLLELCDKFRAHLSRNAFKQRLDGMQERFVTLRVHRASWREAQAALAALNEALHAEGFRVLRSESEYCVDDSRVELDAGWLED